MRAEEVDRGHQHQPGEDASCEHYCGDAQADDVTDAEILRCAVGTDGRAFEQMLAAEVGLVIRFRRPQRKQVIVLKQRVEAAEAESEKNTARKAAAALARF